MAFFNLLSGGNYYINSLFFNSLVFIGHIGLPKAGIYWFGSRVRMPLSGPLGKGLEFMAAGTRTRITGKTTGAIGRFMDQITPEGIKSDAVNVKDMRRALITGKTTPEEASTYIRMLDDNRQRRVIENFSKEEYNRRYNLEVANNPLIQKHKDVLHEIIENPQRLATATPDEIQAKNLVDAWFKSMGDSVQEQMKLVQGLETALKREKFMTPEF